MLLSHSHLLPFSLPSPLSLSLFRCLSLHFPLFLSLSPVILQACVVFLSARNARLSTFSTQIITLSRNAALRFPLIIIALPFRAARVTSLTDPSPKRVRYPFFPDVFANSRLSLSFGRVHPHSAPVPRSETLPFTSHSRKASSSSYVTFAQIFPFFSSPLDTLPVFFIALSSVCIKPNALRRDRDNAFTRAFLSRAFTARQLTRRSDAT